MLSTWIRSSPNQRLSSRPLPKPLTYSVQRRFQNTVWLFSRLKLEWMLIVYHGTISHCIIKDYFYSQLCVWSASSLTDYRVNHAKNKIKIKPTLESARSWKPEMLAQFNFGWQSLTVALRIMNDRQKMQALMIVHKHWFWLHVWWNWLRMNVHWNMGGYIKFASKSTRT